VPLPRAQILVCTNDRGADADKPSCGHRGSVDLYGRLKDRVKAAGLRDEVLVTRTGCLKHCSLGPMVGLWPANRWYGGVAERQVEALVRACAGGGDAAAEGELERLAVPPDAPWE
jgi:(2Fe-2S) ferredoxin